MILSDFNWRFLCASVFSRSKKHKSKKRKHEDSDSQSKNRSEDSLEELDVRNHGGWWQATATHQVRNYASPLSRDAYLLLLTANS